MTEFLVIQTLNAVVYSMLLFILALGLSLTFGLLRIVNLAHGSFFMLGAYVAITVERLSGSFWVALIVAPLVIGLLGASIEWLWLRHFYRRHEFDQVILTFGFTLVFADVVKILWGKDILSLQEPQALDGVVQIAQSVFPEYRLFLIAFGIILFVAMWLCIERTSVGALIRATVSDRDMVSGLGCNVRGLFTGTFAFGALLAAMGGVLGGPIIGVYPGLDVEILITTLIVVVVGGLGNITGAFWAGLLIGASETYGRALFPEFARFVIFVVMAAALLLRSLRMPEEEIE